MTTAAIDRDTPRATKTVLLLNDAQTRVVVHLLTEAITNPEKFGANCETAAAAKAMQAFGRTVRTLRSRLEPDAPPARRARPVAPLASAPEPTPEPTPELNTMVARTDPAAPEQVRTENNRRLSRPTPGALVRQSVALVRQSVSSGTGHFLVIYSKKRRRPVFEGDYPTSQDAAVARINALTDPEWQPREDYELRIISGPRALLARTYPQYFGARRPRRVVGNR